MGATPAAVAAAAAVVAATAAAAVAAVAAVAAGAVVKFSSTGSTEGFPTIILFFFLRGIRCIPKTGQSCGVSKLRDFCESLFCTPLVYTVCENILLVLLCEQRSTSVLDRTTSRLLAADKRTAGRSGREGRFIYCNQKFPKNNHIIVHLAECGRVITDRRRKRLCGSVIRGCVCVYGGSTKKLA